MIQDTPYYTAGEACEVLEMTMDRFQYLVRTGRIPAHKLSGRRTNVYLKRDVDALAYARQHAFDDEPFIFSRSSPGDQVEEMQIGILCFGKEYITPLPERIAFQQKSEYTFWSLKRAGHVVSYVSMFRFHPRFLDDLLTGKRLERDITVKDIRPFVRKEPFDIYIDVLATDPRLPSRLRHQYTLELVSRFTRAVLDLRAHFRINSLYTVTTTKEGDNLVNRRGFQKLDGKSQVLSRTAYKLDLDARGMKILHELSKKGE